MSSSSKKKRAPRKKTLVEPSRLVPRSVCARLEIALLTTGTISNARAKRLIEKGENVPEEPLDEVGVVCAWDVHDEARKTRVRAMLKPFLGKIRITFIGVSNARRDYIERLREAIYQRIETPKRSTTK